MKEINSCIRDRVVAYSKIDCTPYTPSTDVTFGIYPPTDCVKTPADFKRLKDELGFSYLGISPGSDMKSRDIYDTVVASHAWKNSEILLSVDDIAVELAKSPGERSSDLETAYNNIQNFIHAGGDFLGVTVGEPTTREKIGPVWSSWIEEFYKLFKEHGDKYLPVDINVQKIYFTIFFEGNREQIIDHLWKIKDYCDGVIDDSYGRENYAWKYLTDVYRESHNLGAWINISEDHSKSNKDGSYEKLFDLFRQNFATESPKTIWVYPLDKCLEILKEIDKYFEISIPDGPDRRKIVKLTDIRKIISQGMEETHYEADFQKDLNDLFLNPTTRITVRPGISGASTVVRELLPVREDFTELMNFLTSCYKPPYNYDTVGMGGLCHCGKARDAMCRLYCRQLYDFLDAALQNNLLTRKCTRTTRIMHEVWECTSRPPRLWSDKGPDEDFWKKRSVEELRTITERVNPLTAPDYGNHDEECDVASSPPPPPAVGMQVFEDDGLILNQPRINSVINIEG